MALRNKISEILDSYDKSKIAIATLCSHSSLQIFYGARREGFRTIGLAVNQKTKFYDAFPLAKPDEFIRFESYDEILERADELVDRNIIIIPHGSFVEYMGTEKFEKLPVPTFGNRAVLQWESDREKQREWLVSAGVEMPKKISDAKEIDRPVLVKYHGAKGGRGFFIAKDYPDFKLGIDESQPYTIQEYVLGTRYYLHYFYSPIKKDGYRVAEGSLELLSMDRRDESNIDEMYKLGAQEELKKLGLYPTFVVTGNVPVVIRESLLPKIFDMGERVINRSIELFGGMIGPFCLETIVTDKLEFKVFEISSRIVAGTNPFISGSPYSDLIEPELSTGRRISREIKIARDRGLLHKIVS
ncbi:MAG: formate--phosphoribosylaminoimidazolecarboxamide ligase [Methanomassiliicoccales archaeon]|jgi:5-formaminoimidazole-4-carboxamide-1-(beta)-D-ribofuranosyl 5'-monophosphate synthetase|nr:formate--phosphoribosylaminoimidazolecarboxamide ligase [Methanomassiliicoccales archaeon]